MLSLEELQAGEYFWGLQYYRPLCNKYGVPALLTNKDWQKPFTCFLVVNAITAAVIFLLHRSTWRDGKFFILTSICALLLFSCSYLLAQFVNPGIVYRRMQPIEIGKVFTNCNKCGTFSEEGTATHCPECNVCVLDLDHHCGWLGRCVGSYNKWFFYMFLLFSMGMFVNFIVTAVYALDQE